jgi:aryl-alcohol dehydrogenase-like predicted oxidoreductase
LLEVAVGGLAAQPAVASVIAGVTRPEQVQANVQAAEWEPSPEVLAELAEVGRPGQSYTTFAD